MKKFTIDLPPFRVCRNFILLAAMLIIHAIFNLALAQTVTIYRAGTALSPTYSTVKAAIAAAINGDSLKMSAHVFYEHDVLVNKNIVMAGTYFGPDSSTIDAQRLGRVVQLANGKALTIRDVRIINGLANKGKAKPIESIPSGDVGGGIKVDTNALLTVSGGTVIAYNEAIYGGAGISAYQLSGKPLDSSVVSLNDNVRVHSNNNNSIYFYGSSVNDKGKLFLNDNVKIDNNFGGLYAYVTIVGGNPSEGGVEIVNNYGIQRTGLSTTKLFLNRDLRLEHNKADSFFGGIGQLLFLHGTGKLFVKYNSAKFGGGGLFNYFGADSSKVIVYGNKAIYGAGGYITNQPNIKTKNFEIYNNEADSIGGGLYFKIPGSYSSGFSNGDIHHNISKFANGIFVDPSTSLLKMTNSRLYNPDADGKHRGPEIYVAGNSTKLLVDSCWLGQSDTTGMIYTANPADFEMPRWVVANWQVNNGFPVTYFPFPLSARFKLNTGAALPVGSFPMLEGRFSGTMGSFSPALSPMKTSNEIESIYTAASSGPASIMGIVDADTFKANLTVSGIKEVGFEEVNIYPNPASTGIYIEGASEQSVIRVYDIQGKVVLFHSVHNAQAALPIGHLPSGVYQLQITSKEGKVGVAKVVKE